MNAFRYLPALAVLSTTVLSGCGAPPGRPREGSATPAPRDVVEFGRLYSENCAACHGPEGRGGAAIALANPVYLAIADDRSIRTAIAAGVRGTSMPAFAQAAGGMLTEKEIDALVGGIRSRWNRPDAVGGATPPSYAATSAGDTQRGERAYQTFCQSCHGIDGRGGPKASAITNDSFLALTSDQYLRTIVIAGRPELGAPDWRGYLTGPALSSVEGAALSSVEGRPMADQEVTDVVSWLASHRVQTPGRPYAASNGFPQ